MPLNISWGATPSIQQLDVTTANNKDYDRLKTFATGVGNFTDKLIERADAQAAKDKKEASDKAYADILAKRSRVMAIDKEIQQLEAENQELQGQLDSLPKVPPVQDDAPQVPTDVQFAGLDQPLRFAQG